VREVGSDVASREVDRYVEMCALQVGKKVFRFGFGELGFGVECVWVGLDSAPFTWRRALEMMKVQIVSRKEGF